MRVLFVLTLVCPALAVLDFSCRDQNNKPVDWFIFYKIGRFSNLDNQDPHLLNGTAFLYMDANNKAWSFSPMGMESWEQAIGYTLMQYYKNKEDPDVTSIFWSDQLPYPQNGTWSAYHGHSKGLFAFDPVKGFWLIHSIPKFPRNDTYDYPSNAHYYGQMGMCISLSFKQLPKLVTQLYFMRPYIYSYNLPTSVATAIPLIPAVIAGEYQSIEPYTNLLTFTSLGGQTFYHFAKAEGFGKDLYFDWVAQELKVSLKVETWQHGTTSNPNLYSWCQLPNTYHVFNVKLISLPFDITFTNYYDHSKYAVSTDMEGAKNDPWVCIGDIKRMSHQMTRGGGTMCINDPDVYKAYFEQVAEYYTCKDGD